MDQPTAVFKAPKLTEPEPGPSREPARDGAGSSDTAKAAADRAEPSGVAAASDAPEGSAGERTAAAGRSTAAGGATVPEARESSDADTAEAADSRTPADTDAGADAGADTPETAAEPTAADTADDEAESEADAAAAEAGATEAAPDARAGGDGDGDDRDGDGDRDDGEQEDPAPAATAERGVDQPTAVFSTVRKPAARVDQPTTALKALTPRSPASPGKTPSDDEPAAATATTAPAQGNGEAPAGEDADEAPAGRTAPKWATGGTRDTADADGEVDTGTDTAGVDADDESDGRPSTFVPLRTDDVRPAAPKRATPETPARATATSAGPTPDKTTASDKATGSDTATASDKATSGKSTGSDKATASAGATASDTTASDTATSGKATASAGAASTVPPRAAAPNEITAETPAPPASLAEAERTKQQPMPPLPPLDLLAELTNTPPPPETPVRTLVRRVKIWSPLVLLLVIVFAVVQMLRPLPAPSLSLSAEPTYTFGGGKLAMPWPTEGQGAVEVEGVGLIGTYGPQKPAPMASVAKTMTAYVLLRDHPIKSKSAGPKIEIDQLTEEQASNPDWSVAPVKKGQVYTQGELLQLLMIRSANNVAHLLARWDAGSEEAFIKKMNTTAKDLGMTNTTYTDASGFDKGTVSTPVDQLKLAKAAMKDPAFREIVDMPNVTLPQIGRQLENGNTLLLQPGISGVKTGTSTPAGGNLLWSANTVVDGKVRRVLGIVMNVKSPALLSEKTKLAVETFSRGLIDAAKEGVTSAAVVKKGDVVGYVDDGLGGRTPVVATKDLKPVGWAGLEVDLILTDGGKAVPHTAAGGTVVGELAVGSGEGRVSVPVALREDLAEPGFGAKLTRIG
ncbi:D-alanyl-D-alanine carboxypeptidase [Streptomyces kanasensis]|uniref:D-alanyl-D-alanine carboxypeptidase n=1 Tax=Streptomyces kanasensis TaxID=936756 RepID=UPI00382898F5